MELRTWFNNESTMGLFTIQSIKRSLGNSFVESHIHPLFHMSDIISLISLQSSRMGSLPIWSNNTLRASINSLMFYPADSLLIRHSGESG